MKLKSDKRYLIIHADDGGLCHSVNRAIIEALEIGIVTSTSLMVPTPQFEEIARYFQKHPHYDVGIHLTLTCEYPHYPWPPISAPGKVPSLVNSNGNLTTKQEFINHAKPEDVETELQAQIERFLAFGLKPTHLDTHQGTVFHDLRFLETYIKLGLEYKIPPMLLKPNEHAFRIMSRRGLNLDVKVIKKLITQNIPLLDFLFMADNNESTMKERKTKYVDVIKQTPAGVSQIIIHPGLDDEELKTIIPHGYNRYYDFSIFTNSHLKQVIDYHNIELIGWKELSGFSNDN